MWSHGRSRSSTARSTSGGRRLRGCGCGRRRSAATGGRRSPIAGAAEQLLEVARRIRQRAQLVHGEPPRLGPFTELLDLEPGDAHEVVAVALAAELLDGKVVLAL